MKTAEEIIRANPSHTYPTGHKLSGYSFYDEKTIIRAMQEYAEAYHQDQEVAMPSDEGIEKAANELQYNNIYGKDGWICGAKWFRDQQRRKVK